MDYPSQNQTSFIPRKSLVKESVDREKPIGIFLIISVFIFIISCLGAAGVFLYEKKLSGDIESKGKDLKKSQGAFDIETIESLKSLGQRIELSKMLINKHTIVSPIFDLLEKETLKSVRFKTFDYSVDEKGNVAITMGGEAKSYETLALQSSGFSKNKNIRENIFSDINLDEKGNVGFKVKLTIDPKIISYREQVVEGAGGESNTSGI
jgi:hypothetical protein